MNTYLFASNVLLWLVVVFFGFLLLGTLRLLGRLRWRLQQLEATTPTRLGRRGLRRGSKAPDFVLPSLDGGKIALSDFVGRKLLLVFTQSGCAPCRRIVPELNRLHQKGGLRVLGVINGDMEKAARWAREAGVGFPVVVQEGLSLSRRYEAFVTPFAFLISEEGIVSSKGLIKEPEHVGFVLSSLGEESEAGPGDGELSPAQMANTR
jgi:methylamine dehydrogenase accessory protein MauD